MSQNRCSLCRKKTNLLGFKCNYCDKLFCSGHRLPEEHKCEADYKQSSIAENKKKRLDEAALPSHNYIHI
jgi:predicted nucleic acid binding AN1-type Zn finger protein